MGLVLMCSILYRREKSIVQSTALLQYGTFNDSQAWNILCFQYVCDMLKFLLKNSVESYFLDGFDKSLFSSVFHVKIFIWFRITKKKKRRINIWNFPETFSIIYLFFYFHFMNHVLNQRLRGCDFYMISVDWMMSVSVMWLMKIWGGYRGRGGKPTCKNLVASWSPVELADTISVHTVYF